MKDDRMSGMDEIRMEELEGEGCLALRSLWEEVFYEDSREFTDYYFQEKAVRNHAFVLRDREGRVVSMLYLAPYPMMLRVGEDFQTAEINYIIGVATKKEYRHRGYMDRLLRAALRYMYEKKQPFSFLMPANPLIYQPYQFSYIYAKKKLGLCRPVSEELVAQEELSGPEGLSALADFASDFLAQHCDAFIRRDAAYYSVMEKELAAQRGGICLLRGEEGIEGYFLYTREEAQTRIQEAVLKKGVRNCLVETGAAADPVIMARVVDVQALLSLLRTESGEVSFAMEIKDPLLKENDGLWECWITPSAAGIRRGDAGRRQGESGRGCRLPICSIAVENLISWIFGYRPAEECFEFLKVPGREEAGAELRAAEGSEEAAALLRKLGRLKIFKKVFINEIV